MASSPSQSSPSRSQSRKIKWYLDQRGHMCQTEPSSTTLVRRRPKGINVDPADFQYHIFSADTLSELVNYLPQCLVRDGGFPALQNTREIFYSVEFHPKMFDNLDEAAETWERSHESVASRIMLATRDTDRAHWFVFFRDCTKPLQVLVFHQVSASLPGDFVMPPVETLQDAGMSLSDIDHALGSDLGDELDELESSVAGTPSPKPNMNSD
ncbi:hypothetical protein B0H14DRAFT_2592504 [Mycena olivaceomarginata]|nr:hypothetical protein B0H14DRAFT_2592504 [Mycena olivaceomarginata]